MDRENIEDPGLQTLQGTTPTEQGRPTSPLDMPRKSPSSVSSRSQHSNRTACSTTSSVWMKQMAKREAAKVRLQFAEKEAAILRRQAEREALHQKENADTQVDLKLLESKRDLQEAEAELDVMNELLCSEEKYDIESGDDMKRIVGRRTAEYVTGLQPHDVHQCNPSHNIPRLERNLPRVSDANIGTQLHPDATAFTPKLNQESRLHPKDTLTPIQVSGVPELTKYILKKDLILSRLSQYNDKPERYFVWKSSFKNISKELDINPTEELDLLCRWLGPESSSQASSLRAANCANEAEAVRKIWERLDRRYGAPELVLQSFQERFEHFPKITVKDTMKIYELSDLLTEIESLKEDRRYTSSFAYLDSSAGVNPIVSKLPGFMQGKWTDSAMRYKKNHDVLQARTQYYLLGGALYGGGRPSVASTRPCD